MRTLIEPVVVEREVGIEVCGLKWLMTRHGSNEYWHMGFRLKHYEMHHSWDLMLECGARIASGDSPEECLAEGVSQVAGMVTLLVSLAGARKSGDDVAK